MKQHLHIICLAIKNKRKNVKETIQGFFHYVNSNDRISDWNLSLLGKWRYISIWKFSIDVSISQSGKLLSVFWIWINFLKLILYIVFLLPPSACFVSAFLWFYFFPLISAQSLWVKLPRSEKFSISKNEISISVTFALTRHFRVSVYKRNIF